MNQHYNERADAVIRSRIHGELFELLNQSEDGTLGEIAQVEAAVMSALADKSIAWALAYRAGVVLAPELFIDHAQAGPAQPAEDGGG